MRPRLASRRLGSSGSESVGPIVLFASSGLLVD